VEAFLELAGLCTRSRSCRVSVYGFVAFAVGLGLSRATVWRLLRRLQGREKIGWPKKSAICCTPLLETLKVRKCKRRLKPQRGLEPSRLAAHAPRF